MAAGLRFMCLYNFVIILAGFQLGTSGLVASHTDAAPGFRCTMLAALALVLAPLLCVWIGSGPLLVRAHASEKQVDEETAARLGARLQRRLCICWMACEHKILWIGSVSSILLCF
jgi:hypothetical protein